MKLRWVFAVAFVVDVIVHFGAADIPADKLEVPVFAGVKPKMSTGLEDVQGKTDNLMHKVVGGIGTGATIITGLLKKLEGSIKIAETALNFVPIVGQISSLVLNILNFLKEPPPNPLDKLITYVDKKIIKNNQKIAMDKIITAIKSINFFSSGMNSSEGFFETNVRHLYRDLNEVIDHFVVETYSLREYSSVAVPTLLSLAPIAAVVGKSLQSLSIPDDISCRYAAAITQYFQPFLLDRLTNIELDLRNYHFSPGTSNKYMLSEMAGFMNPFDVITEKVTKVSHCDFYQGKFEHQQEKSENAAKTILVNDNLMLEQHKFLVCKENYGVIEYFKLVRYQIQDEFLKAYKLVHGICKNPLKPTGE